MKLIKCIIYDSLRACYNNTMTKRKRNDGCLNATTTRVIEIKLVFFGVHIRILLVCKKIIKSNCNIFGSLYVLSLIPRDCRSDLI